MNVTVTLEHKGRTYTFVPDHCTYDSPQGALYMWTEGNFGCDCNMSLFIQRQCHNGFHIKDCGDTITLTSIVAEDGTVVYPDPWPNVKRDAKGEWTWDSALDATEITPTPSTPSLSITQRPSGLWIVRDSA